MDVDTRECLRRVEELLGRNEKLFERIAAVLAPPVERAPRLSAADRGRLSPMLNAWVSRVGLGFDFKLSELLAHAEADAELRTAVETAVPSQLKARSKVLGQLFRRAVGADVDGLTLHRIGEQGGTALWTIDRTPKVV